MQKHQVTPLQALKDPSVPPTLEIRPAEEVFDKIPTNVHNNNNNNMPLRFYFFYSFFSCHLDPIVLPPPFHPGICYSRGCVYLCTICMCAHLCVNRFDKPASFGIFSLIQLYYVRNVNQSVSFLNEYFLFTGNLSFH